MPYTTAPRQRPSKHVWSRYQGCWSASASYRRSSSRLQLRLAKERPKMFRRLGLNGVKDGETRVPRLHEPANTIITCCCVLADGSRDTIPKPTLPINGLDRRQPHLSPP